MALTIDGLRLWQAQESQSQTQANLNVTTVPTMDGDEAIITGLEAQEQPAMNGTVTANRLAENSNYSSDPLTALSEWIQEFESLAQSEQGSGYTLSDDERNRSIQVIVEEASWTYAYEAPYEASWTLKTVQGEGVLSSAARSPTSATPNTAATLDNQDLGHVREWQTSLKINLETFPIAYGSTQETIVQPSSGMVREFSWQGRKSGSLTDLRNFDDAMRGKLGSNNDATLTTGFPGTQHTVIVGDYQSTFEAGDPHSLRYQATVYEGLAL